MDFQLDEKSYADMYEPWWIETSMQAKQICNAVGRCPILHQQAHQ